MTRMTTGGRDVPFSPSADGWREVVEHLDAPRLIDEAARGRSGRLVVVGGNRRGWLRQVGAQARASGCLVGSVLDPPSRDEVAWMTDVGVAGGQLLAGVGALLVPWLGAVAALGPLTEAVKGRLRQAARGHSPDVLAMLDELVRAAGARTVVLVVDAVESQEWVAELGQVAGRYGLLGAMPVILFCGVEGAPRDLDRVRSHHPSLVRAAARLAKEGRAVWVWIPPLDAGRVMRRAVQVDEAAADALAAASGGDDEQATALWHEWSEQGLLAARDGVLTVTGGVDGWKHRAVNQRLVRAVGADTDRLERARVALATGALQGRAFCGEAVARALAGLADGYTVQALTDDLDDLADRDNPARVVDTDGYVTAPAAASGNVAYYWRYRFRQSTDVRWFRSLLGEDEDRFRGRVLEWLVALHEPTGAYDDGVATLARLAGKEKVAAVFEARHATRERLASLEQHADLLLATARRADTAQLDPYLTRRLIDTAEELLEAGLTARAVTCAERAVAQAAAHYRRVQQLSASTQGADAQDTLAGALNSLGRALLRSGDHSIALPHVTDAREHFQALYDLAPTPATRHGLAATLVTLGQTLKADGDPVGAITHLTSARHHFQALHDAAPTPATRRGLATTLHELGRAHLAGGDTDAATTHLTRAHRLFEILHRNAGTSASGYELAYALHELGRALLANGEIRAACRRFREAISLSRAAGYGELYASAWRLLERHCGGR